LGVGRGSAGRELGDFGLNNNFHTVASVTRIKK
jgi:hypothetical protein